MWFVSVLFWVHCWSSDTERAKNESQGAVSKGKRERERRPIFNKHIAHVTMKTAKHREQNKKLKKREKDSQREKGGGREGG